MSMVNTGGEEQPTVLSLYRPGPTPNVFPAPSHTGTRPGQYLVFSPGPGAAQMAGKGYPYIRVHPVKHDKFLVKTLRKQGAVFVREPGEDQPVSSPASPAIVQEIIDADRSHSNLCHQAVIGSINHVNTVANQGQPGVFTPFLFAFAPRLKYRLVQPFSKFKPVFTYRQPKTGNTFISYRPVDKINLVPQVYSARIQYISRFPSRSEEHTSELQS